MLTVYETAGTFSFVSLNEASKPAGEQVYISLEKIHPRDFDTAVYSRSQAEKLLAGAAGVSDLLACLPGGRPDAQASSVGSQCHKPYY